MRETAQIWAVSVTEGRQSDLPDGVDKAPAPTCTILVQPERDCQAICESASSSGAPRAWAVPKNLGFIWYAARARFYRR